MIANYHTHTPLCHHAVGEPREYVENAIAGGLDTLGFSDHAPMPFPGAYYSGFRMKIHEFDGYIAALKDLQKEYAKDIRLLIGVEAEYYPAIFPDFLDLIRPYGLDYMLLGQHALYNEENAPYTPRPTGEEGLLVQYVDQLCQGLATGEFLYLAHPDMMNFVGDEAIYRREMTRLCRFCKAHNIPLEINLLGIMDHRHYPKDLFWQIASQVGNTAIVGCDAHRPEVLKDHELHRRGEAWAKRFSIPLLEKML